MAENINDAAIVVTKVTRTRYVMLTIYSLSNFLQSFQWLQYTIIANIISRYYNVTIDEVNLTSIVYFVATLLFTIPCNWLLKKIGMRHHVVLGTFFNCLGTLTKCLSNGPDLFYVTLTGQALSAISSAFFEPLPAQIARVWFPTKEASRATSFGLFALFAGNLLASVIPVLLVPDSEKISDIAAGLDCLFFGQALIATIIFLWTMFSFQEKPKKPPSKSEAIVESLRSQQNYWGHLKSVLSINMFLLMAVCGICCAANESLMTVLNELFLSSFEGRESLVGFSGFLFSSANILSTFFFGYLLDKKHWYRPSIYITYALSSFLFFVVYIAMKINNDPMLLVTLTILGFTIASWSSVCVNYAAELTYPLPESISTGLLIMSSELLSAVMTVIVTKMIKNYSKIVTTSFYSVSMIVAIVITFFLRHDLRRKKNEREMTAVERNTNKCENSEQCERLTNVEETIRL